MKRTELLILLTIVGAGCGLQAQLNGDTGPNTAAASSSPMFGNTNSSPSPRTAKTIKAPNLIDLPVAEAKRRLRGAGFSGTISLKENSGCGFTRSIAGRAVCRSLPYAGNPINKHITLMLSGPEAGKDHHGTFARIPNVMGWTGAKAKAHLAKLGFKLFSIDTTFRERNKAMNVRCRPGLVCFQRPLPGVRTYHKHHGRLTLGEAP